MKEILEEITDVIYLTPEGYHIVILQLSARDRFTKEEQDAIYYIRTLFTDEILKHMIIIWSDGNLNPEDNFS
jgi:hypothetical protein